MLDLAVNYILLNVALFGGLYVIAKYVEYITWELVVWSTESF